MHHWLRGIDAPASVHLPAFQFLFRC